MVAAAVPTNEPYVPRKRPLQMSKATAKLLVADINYAIEGIGEKLHRLDTEKGYKALGFETMEQLIESSYFTKGRSTLYRKLRLAKVEERVTGVVGLMVETHAAELNKFPAEYQQFIYDYAKGRAEIMGKKLSASIISVAGRQVVSMGVTGTVNGENLLDDAFNEAMREWRLQHLRRDYLINGEAFADYLNGVVRIPMQELPEEAGTRRLYFAVWAVDESQILD